MNPKDWDSVFPSWVGLVYGVLFSLSIPWYVPTSLEMVLIFGLPLWLVACIAAIVCIAIFSIVIIVNYWREVDDAN